MASRRWFRLDVGWSRSEWLADLDPAARLAWVEVLGYAKAEGAGGRVKLLSPRVFGRMIAVDAADVEAMIYGAMNAGALQVVDGDWVIAKWDEYQQPDNTAAERMRRHRQSRPVTEGYGVTPVTQPVTRRVTLTETETETEEKKQSGASAPRTKRKHFIPEGWEPNDRHRQKAFAEGIDCDREAEKFRDHAAANNRKQVDWDAAFRLWLGNARPAKAEKKPVYKNGFRPYEDYTEDEWIAKVQAELI